MSEILTIKNINAQIKSSINRIPLMPGNYYLSIVIFDKYTTGILAHFENATGFKVMGNEQTGGIFKADAKWTVIDEKS